MFKSKFLQEAEARGFINQCTNIDELDRRLSSNKPVVAYWGTDPTAQSLHVGHLYSLMLLRLFQRCGNKPIVLLGGATGLVGDPSFKDKTRPMLSPEQIRGHETGIRYSIEKFIKFGDKDNDAVLVNNIDWFADKKYLEILREIGPHVSVNRMLSFESVKLRLAKEEHLSFLEFNYMILQAYDFYHLYKKYGCTLQLCGADQWGNAVAGVDLIRRLQYINNLNTQETNIQSSEVITLSTALLVDSKGKKVGKSEGNAIWLNEQLLDPYKYYQYFRNIDDNDVVRFLKVYTDFDLDQIAGLQKTYSNINDLKKILAFEATRLCHGEDNAKKAHEKAVQIFENSSIDHLDVLNYNLPTVKTKLSTMLKDLDLSPSLSEARRLIAGGAVRINDVKTADIILGDDLEFKLSLGKKKMFLIKLSK